MKLNIQVPHSSRRYYLKIKLVRRRSNQSKYAVNTSEESHTIDLLSIQIDNHGNNNEIVLQPV